MASLTQSPASFIRKFASRPTAISYLHCCTSNSFCGVPLKPLGRAQLGGKMRHFSITATIREVKGHEHPQGQDCDPVTLLEEMIKKLNNEIDYECDEASKALGIMDKLLMLSEEAARAGSLEHASLRQKSEQLRNEFDKNLPSAPNYPRLKYKLDMLNEISKTLILSKKRSNVGDLKRELSKRLSEVMDRPDVRQKVEILKAEIANSKPELKENVSQLDGEIELELNSVLEPLGLDLQMVSSNSDAITKMTAFINKVGMMRDDVVSSSHLKEKLELLKAAVEKAGNTLDEESQSKIQALGAEIRQAITQATNSPELKEKEKSVVGEVIEAVISAIQSGR